MKKKYIIIILFFVLIGFIFYFLIAQKKGIVIDHANRPEIRLTGKEIHNINHEIETIYNMVKKQNGKYTYQYYKGKDILSLLIEFTLKDPNSGFDYTTFMAYNINLHNKQKMTEKEILEYYQVTLDDVSKKIEKRIKMFYDWEQTDGYIEQRECDFACYLQIRGIQSYTDDIVFYINGETLSAYKSFDLYSIYDDDDFFPEDAFQFIIKEI